MAGKAEIIIGVINDGVTVGAGATAVADQCLTNNHGMALLNQSAQTGAVLASVTSVTKLAGPYVPIISLPANVMAGSITFLKIGVDIRDDGEFSAGDVVTLIGNVAGVIGAMVILAGAGPAWVGAFTLTSVTAGLYSIGASKLAEQIINSAGEFFSNTPAESHLNYLYAPDMSIVDRNTIRNSYGNMMLSCDWTPGTDELLPSSVLVPEESNTGGGGGSAFSGAPGPSGPMIIPPPHDVANIGLSIIVNGETYDAGDQYGCCTGTSDGYF